MCVGSPTAGTWSSSQWRPDDEFETDRPGVEIPREVCRLGREVPEVDLGDLRPFVSRQIEVIRREPVAEATASRVHLHEERVQDIFTDRSRWDMTPDRQPSSTTPSMRDERRYTLRVDRRSRLAHVCRRLGVEAVYLFGSRADDGVRVLDGESVDPIGSDIDIGLFFRREAFQAGRLADLQVTFEDIFAPLRVDLVVLDQVDALFQYRAIDGHRVFALDAGRADRAELVIMRRAAELLPIQREIEREMFGVSTS
jgi:predicted nucleotidyltransferase